MPDFGLMCADITIVPPWSVHDEAPATSGRGGFVRSAQYQCGSLLSQKALAPQGSP